MKCGKCGRPLARPNRPVPRDPCRCAGRTAAAATATHSYRPQRPSNRCTANVTAAGLQRMLDGRGLVVELRSPHPPYGIIDTDEIRAAATRAGESYTHQHALRRAARRRGAAAAAPSWAKLPQTEQLVWIAAELSAHRFWEHGTEPPMTPAWADLGVRDRTVMIVATGFLQTARDQIAAILCPLPSRGTKRTLDPQQRKPQ